MAYFLHAYKTSQTHTSCYVFMNISWKLATAQVPRRIGRQITGTTLTTIRIQNMIWNWHVEAIASKVYSCHYGPWFFYNAIVLDAFGADRFALPLRLYLSGGSLYVCLRKGCGAPATCQGIQASFQPWQAPWINMADTTSVAVSGLKGVEKLNSGEVGWKNLNALTNIYYIETFILWIFVPALIRIILLQRHKIKFKKGSWSIAESLHGTSLNGRKRISTVCERTRAPEDCSILVPEVMECVCTGGYYCCCYYYFPQQLKALGS